MHLSWGRYPKIQEQESAGIHWLMDRLPKANGSLLPYGLGRSYGDSCLNEGNTIVHTRGLNRFIAFDRSQGLLRCEAGVSFEEILRLIVPQGWFLPVTPGTQYVTVGGAIANDVHGKNHHRAGTFCHHVTRFELLRSDGSRLLCSPSGNPEWFRATIGGLGLTGLITWAEFRLTPIANPWITQEVIRYQNVDEFFRLSRESESNYDFTVSWIDCLASGESLGRGLFIRGNHAPSQTGPGPRAKTGKKSVPVDFPGFALNGLSVRAFNSVYYRKPTGRAVIHYDPFFYPLDAILHWNRIYGRRGFLQYQFVLPFESDSGAALREVLGRISKSGTGSFLAVLKTFGKLPSLGMLSFPRPGVTLALDFPYTGAPILRLLAELDQIITEANGAIYPAKDARMSPGAFERFYPQYREFSKYIDPQFSSSFWRRVTS